jgi:hypothetical protein|nr:MAG TPA: prohead serine protease [Caudoviricetes sp.]
MLIHLTADCESDGQKITGLAVPYGEYSGPDSLTGQSWRFAGGPADPTGPVPITIEHDQSRAAGVIDRIESTEAGLHVTGHLIDTAAARDIRAEMAAGIRAGVSVGALICGWDETDSGRDVTSWSLDHVSIVRKPAFPSTHATIYSQKETMAEPEVKLIPNPGPAELPSLTELAAAVAKHLQPAGPAEPALSKYASGGHFLKAFYAADSDDQPKMAAEFAVPDQILTDNPGLQQPQWRSQILMYIATLQPLITAFGRVGITSDTIAWPYLDPATDIDKLIKQQAAEKTELEGLKVKFLKGTAPVNTAGAVSDISYQLLRLSDPSYLEAYLRVMSGAYARYEEAIAEAAAVRQGTAAGELPQLTTPAQVHAWLAAASADVQDAMGAPADTVIVDRATWVKIASIEYPQNEGTGTSRASTLRVNVSGLDVKIGPFLAADQAIVTNSAAASFASTGHMIATAEDVRKLGRDVAIYGLYSPDLIAPMTKAIRVYKKS